MKNFSVFEFMRQSSEDEIADRTAQTYSVFVRHWSYNEVHGGACPAEKMR